MMTHLEFNKVVEKNMERLTQFTPIVLRVHGEHHPEMEDVSNYFNQLAEKIEKDNLNLEKEFNGLREVTNNYEIPTDVCESYAAVYEMLEELDEAYQK